MLLTITNKKNKKNFKKPLDPKPTLLHTRSTSAKDVNEMKTQVQKNGKGKWIVGIVGKTEEVEREFAAYYLNGATNNPNPHFDGEDAEGKTLLRFYSTEAKFQKALVNRHKNRMILKMRELADEMQTFNVLGLAASIVHGAKREAEKELERIDFVTDLFKYDSQNDGYSVSDDSAENPDYDGTDSDRFRGHGNDFDL